MKNLFVFTVFLFFTQSIFAQSRFSVEVRGGASFATEKLGNTDLKTGFGFEGILAYRLVNNMHIYAGWGWNQFTADQSFAGSETTFEETGYLFGLQLTQPIIDDGLAIYVRAGAIYNHIELENKGGDITADTGHGWGWQAAAGLEIPLGSNWQLTPGIKYQALSRDVTLETFKTSLDLRYVNVGIGLVKKF